MLCHALKVLQHYATVPLLYTPLHCHSQEFLCHLLNLAAAKGNIGVSEDQRFFAFYIIQVTAPAQGKAKFSFSFASQWFQL